MRYRRGVARSAIAVLVSAVAVAALAGCGTKPVVVGQPNVQLTGVSVTSADHSVAVRDLAVADSGPRGYRAGSPASLLMQLWNNTTGTVTLTGLTVDGGAPVELVKGASPTQGQSTFSIPVPAGGPVRLVPGGSGQYLRISCLPRDFLPGMTLAMTFHFDNGATVAADVPMAGDNPVVPQAAPNDIVSGGPGTAAC